jgi:hypothetical protein
MPEFSIQSAIQKTGVKPAQTKFHGFLRAVLLIGLIVLVVLSIHLDYPKNPTLGDMSDTIPPDTIMYNMINEMDEDLQCRYLYNLQIQIEPRQSRIEKYINGIRLALAAGIASEYMINGNSVKPLGILAKTIVYSVAYTMVSS